MSIPFVRDLEVEYGAVTELTPTIRRVIANNPSAFTFHGTGTYIVGRGEVAVIDPGPLDHAHIAALLQALDGETVTHILITHTHNDHSPAAAPLKVETGAPTYGFGPHGGNRRGPRVEEGGDWNFEPDHAIGDGAVIDGPGWSFEAVHTPGHTSNHLCFALRGENILFSGDHVMGWSTSVIAPPDGNMADYLASLEKLLDRDDKVYWPTHGPAITKPQPFVRAFLVHRSMREQQIKRCLEDSAVTIEDLVKVLYASVDPRLRLAASRMVLAHLIHMVGDGRVTCEGEPDIDSIYSATG
ncbi:MAG: MBL fold metallo-hydrolase [Alphaproteobacteria bacterium]|nr:MBL fold metallo-hydrolase [Alphaproteobacteria bacterium]